MTIVLSQLRILTVVSDTSSTVPSAPYLGMAIQSPTLSMSLAESWMPDTKPRMLSRKISINTAAEAPNPVSRIAGERLSRIEIIRIVPIRYTIPCPVCRSPLIGLPCQALRLAAMSKTARMNVLSSRRIATTIYTCVRRTIT